MRTLLSALIAMAVVTPAFAADESYVVRDGATKKCAVVDKKPTTATSKIVGDDTVYKPRAEAHTAIKTVKVCSEK